MAEGTALADQAKTGEPPEKRRRAGYIAVEGPIGVGKTSLAQRLGRELSARLVLEAADDNPFLSRFYENPDKYAFAAQLYFLLSRYSQQRALAQQELFSPATVADYLFARDRIFAQLNLTPDEFKLYERVYQLLDGALVKPDLVVYIRASVDVLIDRLRKRNRAFERNINYEYLEKISDAYRDFFFYYDESPLLVVDTSDLDFVANPGHFADLMREIERAGPGVRYVVPRYGTARS